MNGPMTTEAARPSAKRHFLMEAAIADLRRRALRREGDAIAILRKFRISRLAPPADAAPVRA